MLIIIGKPNILYYRRGVNIEKNLCSLKQYLMIKKYSDIDDLLKYSSGFNWINECGFLQ